MYRLGAIFPDIDVFAGPIAHNSFAIIEWHRNITHSLILLPVWALVMALLSVGDAALTKEDLDQEASLVVVLVVTSFNS